MVDGYEIVVGLGTCTASTPEDIVTHPNATSLLHYTIQVRNAYAAKVYEDACSKIDFEWERKGVVGLELDDMEVRTALMSVWNKVAESTGLQKIEEGESLKMWQNHLVDSVKIAILETIKSEKKREAETRKKEGELETGLTVLDVINDPQLAELVQQKLAMLCRQYPSVADIPDSTLAIIRQTFKAIKEGTLNIDPSKQVSSPKWLRDIFDNCPETMSLRAKWQLEAGRVEALMKPRGIEDLKEGILTNCLNNFYFKFTKGKEEMYREYGETIDRTGNIRGHHCDKSQVTRREFWNECYEVFDECGKSYEEARRLNKESGPASVSEYLFDVFVKMLDRGYSAGTLLQT